MKKKIEKKNQRSLLTGTYQTKNKKSLSIPKKSNSKTQEKITKESKSLGQNHSPEITPVAMFTKVS